MITIPVIETERLILRGVQEGDFEPFAKFSSSERSRFVGGPASREEAWRAMAMMVGHWELRGFGMWWLEEKKSHQSVGRVGLWSPEGWPAPELGWVIYEEFEGKGFAHEAAAACRDYAYGPLKMTSLISLIATDNTRSIALAERMKCTLDGTWTSPAGKVAQIYCHPIPEAPK